MREMIEIEVDARCKRVLDEIAKMSDCTLDQVVAVLLAQYIVRMEALENKQDNINT